MAEGLGDVPPRTLKGGELPALATRHEWGPKLWRTLSPRGWAKGVEGAQAPSQGVWGLCPQNKKGGE